MHELASQASPKLQRVTFVPHCYHGVQGVLVQLLRKERLSDLFLLFSALTLPEPADLIVDQVDMHSNHVVLKEDHLGLVGCQ
jgi:hypothetical protein